MSLFPSTEKKPFCRTYAKEKRCNLKKDYNASENPYSILPDVSDMICRKDLGVMEYMSCPEAAKKWGISERRVQVLCRENRIPGVSKLGYMWLIPKDAEKPIDGRTKRGKELHHE